MTLNRLITSLVQFLLFTPILLAIKLAYDEQKRGNKK